MANAYKGLLFDKDGVLVDFDKTWAPVLYRVAERLSDGDEGLQHELLRAAGYDVTQDRFSAGSVWAAGHSIDLAKAWLELVDLPDCAAIIKFVEDECAQQQVHGVLPQIELIKLIQELKNVGYCIGLATNDSASSAHTHLCNLGVRELFDCVLGYDSTDDPKPGAGPLKAFCRHCNIAAEQVIMIGDNRHDMEMARAGGAGLAVAVLSGNSQVDDIDDLADAVLPSIADLPDFLAELGS